MKRPKFSLEFLARLLAETHAAKHVGGSPREVAAWVDAHWQQYRERAIDVALVVEEIERQRAAASN